MIDMSEMWPGNSLIGLKSISHGSKQREEKKSHILADSHEFYVTMATAQ